MKRYGITIVALVAALAGTTLATGTVSSIVGPNGTINGCYKAQGGEDDASKGQLRVVAAGVQCKQNELAIQWSQQGPKGDAGAQGPAGPEGSKGEAGAVGPQGPHGETGATGPEGPQGSKGEQGPDGPAGPKGEQGEQGEQGAAGATGPAGQDGAAGPQGPAGPKGDEGLHWRGSWDTQLNYPAGDVVSYGGASWVARPATENGTTAGYAPPDNLNEWSLLADKGSHGDQGVAGAQGVHGPKGDTGAQGPAGPPGPSATPLWAAVGTNGAFLRGSGVTGTIRLQKGTYQVTFNRAVNTCAYAATPLLNQFMDIQAGPSFLDNAVVFVNTWRGYDLIGNPAFDDSAFSLAVFC